MEETNQDNEVIGMDAHSRKLVLCHMRRAGGKLVKVKTVATTLDAMEATYAKQMPPVALTVLEASGNSFSIARRLNAIGRRAKVLNSDILSGLSREDRVNDRIDAENLARVYLNRIDGLREVFAPSEAGVEMRETLFAYRDARKDATRAANRIWALCNRHGLDVDHRMCKSRGDTLLNDVKARGWTAPMVERAESLVAEWGHADERCGKAEKTIERAVFRDERMRRLLQVPGVRYICAFALVAFVEDISRFDNPKKLVSYIGLNPSVSASGEKEGRRGISDFGRSDLKSMFVEAAQSAMRTDCAMTRWARHLLAEGKEWNKVMVALARKLVVLCWHILMGHPTPSREREGATAKKLVRLAHLVGKELVREANYSSADEFAKMVCSTLYAHLPEKPVGDVALLDNA